MEEKSFSQFGEDLIISKYLSEKGITQVRYLDIGAGHPQIISNTYYFYLKGNSGVLVEPLPRNISLIKEQRPRDTLIEAVVIDKTESEIFVKVKGRTGGGSYATYMKPRPDQRQVTTHSYRIHEVFETHFPDKLPDFVSIDIEGWDYRVLKDWDFNKYPVSVVMAEMRNPKEIIDHMKFSGYDLLLQTRENGVFTRRPI